MRFNRNTKLLASLLLLVAYINLSSVATKDSSFTESYPAVVCPPNTANLTSFISLPSSEEMVRKTGTLSMAMKKAGQSRIPGSTQALVVDSKEITPLTWQARSGTWAGAVTCIAPVSSQWFVGGSADVTSKGEITIVNSGLGKALVSLTVYTDKGAAPEKVVSIAANSQRSILLSYLAPGSAMIAIHLVPQTGRVTAFLIDERGRGLQSLGGDTVNSTPDASKSIVIPAIPHTAPKGRQSLSHTLRILVPGEIPAQISAEISYPDGSFAPAGIDGRTISPGKVVEIPLKLVASTGKYALSIKSDQPLVAAVKSSTYAQGKSDFVWSTQTAELTPASFAVTGLAPTLVFAGEKIEIELQLNSPKGKITKSWIRGTGVATFVVGEKVRTVTILKAGKGLYGAALISSKSGYGFAPLVQGSALTRSSVPRSNIRVLIP